MKLQDIILTERISFDTSEFVKSHGRQPQGFGLWMFRVEIRGREARVIEIPASRFGDAKKKVEAQLADERRLDPVAYVLP